jgi:PAS domain-containing protein
MLKKSLSGSRLTTQVLVWVIGISVLIFAAATVLTALHQSNQLFNEARENARHSIDRNLAAISTGLWTFDKPALEATLAALTQYGSVVRATVRDSEGEVVATSDRSSDSAPPETAWDVAVSGPGGSQRIGTLQVAESYRDVREAFIRTLVAGLVSELAKTGALAALLFLVIYRLITRHLQDLARQVAYLGRSDADRLVVLRRRPRRDELDTLVDSINRFRSGRIDAEKALLNDISERKRIELELKRTQTELSEALEIAHLAYWEFDPARSEFTFNDQYYSLHRTRAAEVGGYRLPLDEYCRRLVRPEDRVQVKAFIDEALHAANDDPGRQLEMRILCADAVPRWTLFLPLARSA